MSKKKHKKKERKSVDHKNQKTEEQIEHEKMEEGLRYIYELEEDGTKDNTDMSKLDMVSSPIIRRILLSTLLILIAIAAGLAGAFFLSNPMSQNDSQLTFDINLEDTNIISGEETEITIPYRNPSTNALASLEVMVHMPKNFVYKSSTPEPFNIKPLTWNLGTLSPGENGEIKIEGIFNETPGNAATIQAITRYMPSNFSSPFEDIETESILIKDSIYKTEITGSEKAIPGEEQTYNITVSQSSSSEEPIENTLLTLSLPTGFTITETSTKALEEGKPIWKIEELPKDEPFELKIKGQYASDISGKQTITATTNVKVDTSTVEQSSAETHTDVLASDLALSLIVNGEAGDSIIMPGSNLAVNVALANRGEEASEEIKIEFFIDEGLDRLNLEERGGIPMGDIYDNKINWDKTDMQRLETLRGGEDASIDISIPTKDEGPTEIILHAEATIKTVGELEINRFIKSSKIKIRIASDIQANASARYYENDGTPIGTGPIPPEVGKETSYRVTWTVANALNDAEDVVMQAEIPEDAKWSGLLSASKGTLHYDQVANRVRWAIGDITAGSPPPIATFDIKITPRETHIGKFVDILKEATVTGFDKITGTNLQTKAQNITTEIPSDTNAKDKGVVMNPEENIEATE